MNMIALMDFWDLIVESVFYADYYFEATLFIALITLPTLQKRPYFALRALGCLAIIGFLYWLFFWPLSGIGTWFSLTAYLILFLLYIVSVFVCFKVTFTKAIFYGTMAHAIQNLSTHIYIILTMTLYNLGCQYHVTEFCDWGTVLALGVGCYFLVSRRIKDQDLNFNAWSQVISVSILIVFSVFLNMLYDLTGVVEGVSREINNYILFHGAMLAADLLLILYQLSCYRYSNQEKDEMIMHKIHSLEKRQMNETKSLMDAISIKSHDLKHQLLKNDSAVNEYKQEAMEQIALYDSFANTGNEFLDVILTQKKLYCSENQIDLRFIADGSTLNFIKSVDLYSLLGNLLDNAIEACKNLEPERRYVFLRITKIGNNIVLHIENEHNGKLNFVNGLPQTTKQDKNLHGFGVRSIKNIVEKYHGIMSITDENSVYSTDIVFNQEQD